MIETFFISDTHFGHKKIITYEPLRAFNTIDEHDATLVMNWNTVVGKKDIVWHLGDFCFGLRNLQIAGELNGLKKLVLGNHDTYRTEEYLKYFHKVYGAVEYKGMILTHIPVHPIQLERYKMNVHGHLHANNIDHPRYINVSAEQQNLSPVNIEEFNL